MLRIVFLFVRGVLTIPVLVVLTAVAVILDIGGYCDLRQWLEGRDYHLW